MFKKNYSPKISVIIPTFNSWETLRKCLLSIIKQSLKPNEVIVIDNGSTDKTSQNIEKYFKNVKLITLSKNTGVTGGRNTGIRTADKKSNYFFFFDHDMIGERKMLEELVRVAEQAKDIGIVTPKIFYQDDKKRIWSAGTSINLWTGQVLFRGGKDFGQYEENEEVQVAPAAMLVKKEVIRKIKGFDDKYFATYEDTDFCFRARRVGFKTYYCPEAIAYHKLPKDPKEESVRLLSRAYWVGRNRIIFMKKFGRNFFVFLLFLPIFCMHYLIMAAKFQRYKEGLNFLRGTLVGLVDWSIPEVRIPFSYMWILKEAIGKKTNTILDLGCGDGKLMKTISPELSWQVTGVDIDNNSIKVAQVVPVYKQLIVGDLEEVVRKLVGQGKKYDAVFCSQAIEHLPKTKGERLLDLIEKLAKSKIIVTTPNGFMEQIEESLGKNPHQYHRSGWAKGDFSKRGYSVRGLGFRLAWSSSGFSREQDPFIAFVFRVISFVTAPVVYYFPSLGASLLAVKNKHDLK